MHREAFQSYLRFENREKSGKATSYVRALDLLAEMLAAKPLGFGDCADIWSVSDVSRLQSLLLRVREEEHKKDRSAWTMEGIPPSYLQGGFCSAALKSYKEYLVIHPYEQKLWDIYNDPTLGEEERAARLLETEPESAEVLIEDTDIDFNSREGRDVLSATKSRRGQDFFRKMILHQYENRCCITGLEIPQLCIASHIIRWSDRIDTRMDPRNGLCLSATYDKAFENHLISLDEDYRLLVSPSIRDHYRNDHARELFEKREGQVILMPESADRWPLQWYLEEHRGKVG